MSTAPTTLEQAIERCAQEPIQVPGSIQPQGFLLVLDPDDLRILQASENAERWLGEPAAQLLGQALPALLAVGADLRTQLAGLPADEIFPFHIGDLRLHPKAPWQAPLRVLAHSHDQVLILEFEPSGRSGTHSSDYYPLVRSFVSTLHQASSIDELLQQSVRQIKRITGFGRVKAYRFDDEGNGTVLAEDADPGYPQYLGLCFPASDIPRQARELYRVNRIRVIEDADYQPSPLLPAANPRTGKPLDMSFASLRSVSPVHLQYMRNMGTLASMSLSIVVDGKLWGLVSCHHTTPRAVDFQTRTACELLASLLSLQIEAHESHSGTRFVLDLRQRIVRMLGSMADHDSVSEGLLAMPEVMLQFAGAQGAAIISAERCELIGQTPPAAQVNALVHWLGERDEPVFHSDNVRRDITLLPELASHVGGVLAVAISQIHSHYLLWFRPEQVRTVNWAGEPNKQISAQGHLDPRHSFARWQQELRGFSAPWEPLIVEGVLELRGAVLGIVMRKAEELAQLAGELKRSNKELEAFSYSVSHDLRAPLRHIAGYSELLGEVEGEHLTERGRRFLSHIEEAAAFAGTLVDNLLNFSQMGRSALRLSEVDLNLLVENIRSEMAPDYAGREVVWEIAALPRVHADPAFINMALTNLIANALKYTRGREPARIEVGAVQHSEEIEVYVRDNGVGFDMAYVDKLFGVFQRLHRMEEFEGTGIGLASVRRIIERHDGRVWADGQLGQGASFHFTLPRPAAAH